MECDSCEADAVYHAAYSGRHLCDVHLVQSVEKRVRRRVREDNLLPRDATPENPETWVVGLSGGKDSAVLATILQETFDADPRVELIALSVHEGIEDYRDKSLAACRALVDDIDLQHEIVTYETEFDLKMDDVVKDDPLDMTPCAYCGVFRRNALSNYATELGADKLITGHNLDDVAETALMNFLEGDVAQMARNFDASLGPFPGSEKSTVRGEREGLVPRSKPLRDIPEKEVALYARARDLPVHFAECPHATEAYRGEIQNLLLQLEERHPGTRHSIVSGYEELASMAASRYHEEARTNLGECDRCGSTTARDVCRACRMRAAL